MRYDAKEFACRIDKLDTVATVLSFLLLLATAVGAFGVGFDVGHRSNEAAGFLAGLVTLGGGLLVTLAVVAPLRVIVSVALCLAKIEENTDRRVAPPPPADALGAR